MPTATPPDDTIQTVALPALLRQVRILRVACILLAGWCAVLSITLQRWVNRPLGEFAAVKAQGYFLYDQDGQQRGEWLVDKQLGPHLVLRNAQQRPRLEVFGELPSEPRPRVMSMAGLRCFNGAGDPDLLLYSDQEGQAMGFFPSDGYCTSLQATSEGSFLRLDEHLDRKTFSAHLGASKEGGGSLALRSPRTPDGQYRPNAGLDFGFVSGSRQPTIEAWHGNERRTTVFPQP